MIEAMMRWPLKEVNIIHNYGIEVINGRHRFHSGVDLQAKNRTSVYNVAPGIVHKVGYDARGGYYVVVDHMFFRTKFLHLAKIQVVTGDMVDTSAIIALSGNTGESTNPHLHFEVNVSDGVHFFPIDPVVFLESRINNLKN